MATELCKSCNGQKVIMGLGSMYHDCTECDGIGYVKQYERIVEDEVVKEFKRRGRPPKNVE